MDGWQAAQNWAVFAAIAAGLGWYYYPRKQTSRVLAPLNDIKEVKETKRNVKNLTRKQDVPKPGGSGAVVADEITRSRVNNKKRKVNAEAAAQNKDVSGTQQVNDEDDDAIDMSTRQFAANLQRAREGITVKSTSTNESKIKTVKPKATTTNDSILSSSPPQVDTDDQSSPVVLPAPGPGGVDDMLEPTAPGPSALRITVADKPAKEKVNKQPKKEVIETKKQRQNKKKVEELRIAREMSEKERAAQAEKQRRLAREARGEPAKNGIAVSRRPVSNAWTNGATAQQPAMTASDNTINTMQLLDTLDTESNSSSNQEGSTAATSVVAEAAPRRWADEQDLAKAVEESERDSGWSEVKVSKKSKKKGSAGESKGDVTPVVARMPAVQHASNFKAVGFQSLTDEGENGDSGDLANWTA